MVKKPSKYILLIDPREEILSLQETALRCFYSGEVVAQKNSVSGLEAVLKFGNPDLIIMDSQSLLEDESSFYRHVESEGIASPFIVFCNDVVPENLSFQYPAVTAMLEKPKTAHAYTYLVKSLTAVPSKDVAYVPIKTSILLRLGMGHFDLYLKLSDRNFVKIIHKGEPFFETDAKRLSEKGIYELHIRHEDSSSFLKFLEKDISVENKNPIEDISHTLENLETFEEIAKAMGWSPTVMDAAQKSVHQAVKILSKNVNILSTLKRRLKDPSSPYSRHIGLLTYLVCAFSSSLGWIGEAGQVKLAMAALIHDVAVDEDMYENIHEWNKKAANAGDKSPETIRYRMHPYEASKVIRSLDSFSPDVDQIILQHHEIRDGSGFPRGLDSSRIGHLPALFIIVEDLVEFIDNGDNIETSITDFITWGSEKYDSGHFKKIFQGFVEKLKLQS